MICPYMCIYVRVCVHRCAHMISNIKKMRLVLSTQAKESASLVVSDRPLFAWDRRTQRKTTHRAGEAPLFANFLALVEPCVGRFHCKASTCKSASAPFHNSLRLLLGVRTLRWMDWLASCFPSSSSSPSSPLRPRRGFLFDLSPSLTSTM